MANTSNVPRWAKYAGAGALALMLTVTAWAHDRYVVAKTPSTDAAAAVVAAQTQPGDPAPAVTAGTAQTASTAPAIINYTVQPGDTLWDIAIKNNTDVTSIMALNSLTRSSNLKLGQTLKILTIKGTIHKVKSGDTLSGIASSYGVGADAISKANGISNQHALSIGQELIIPGGQPKMVASAETSRGSSTRSSHSSNTTSKSSGTGSSSGSGAASGFFSWPVRGPITSGFGARWGSQHTGIDIAVPTGTSVKAARAGTVIRAGWLNGYGNAVEIDHGNGVTTLYGHNSVLLVSKGDHVEAGDVIARSGSTGHSTGPHVHFEVRHNGKAVSPLKNGL